MDDPAIVDVFDCWRENHAPGARLDPKRAQRIRQRLAEGFSADELKAAIRGALRDDWIMGRDPKSTKPYRGVETILRDAGQVERLAHMEHCGPILRMAPAPPPPPLAPGELPPFERNDHLRWSP